MSGGTQLHDEDGNDKITFRLSTRLKQQYKERVDNMSADLEEYVRRRVDEPADQETLERLEEPADRDLAIAYRTLCKKRNQDGIVRGKTARKALAQSLSNVDQEEAMVVLRRLERLGYLHLQSSPPPSSRLAVHVRPFSLQGDSRGR